MIEGPSRLTDLPRRVGVALLEARAPAAGPLRAIAAVVLALAGCVAWADFFAWGELAFTAHDWPKELDYYAALGEALRTGAIPWHAAASHQGTDRLLANPEVPFSPEILLLRWMGPGAFVLARTLLWFLVGLGGCIALASRLALPAAGFAALALLALFNGHVTAHLSVGHSMWVGYFLLPWLAWALLRATAPRAARRDSALVALVLALLAATGALHLFVIASLFTLALAAFERTAARRLLEALLLGAALSAWRLVPGLVTLGSAPRPGGFGFPDLFTLARSLVEQRAMDAQTWPLGAGWWELDTYVGLEGLVLLAVGAVLAVRRGEGRGFVFAALALALLSLGRIYSIFHVIPGLGAERVVTRFLGLACALLAPVALAALVAELRERGWSSRPAAAVLAVVTIGALGQALFGHLDTWSQLETAQSLPGSSAVLPRGLAPRALEPGYANAVAAGLAVSVAAALGVLRLMLGGASATEAERPEKQGISRAT